MLFLSILLASTLAFALPESDLSLAHDAIRHLPEYSIAHEITGQAGVRVHSLEFKIKENPGGPIVVVIPGRGEASGKYFELAYDLAQAGVHRTFVLDHRGQGFSPRIINDPFKGYVEDFQFFVKDLAQWLNEIVLPRAEGGKVVLAAHSMGGAIAAGYLQSIAGTPLQQRYTGIVFTSPMFGIQLAGQWLEKLAETSCKPGSTACSNYILGAGPPKPSDGFSQNGWTSSESRWKLNRDFYSVHSSARLGGPTWGWLNQALIAMHQLREHPALGYALPITLFQAGNETIVDNAAEEAFCNAQASCQLIRLESAKHTIFEERDELRNQAVNKILELGR